MRMVLDLVVVFAPLLAAYAAAAIWGGNGLVAGIAFGLPGTLLSVWLATRVLARSKESWKTLGLARPESGGKLILWTLATIVVVSLSIGIIQNLFLLLRMGSGVSGGEPLEVLRGNRALLVLSILGVWIVSAFGEELLFRGFLLNRLLGVFPTGKSGAQGAVILSAVLCGLAHIPQGGLAVLYSGVAGIGYATLYVGSGRSLWVTILAHGVIDTLAIWAYASSPVSGAP